MQTYLWDITLSGFIKRVLIREYKQFMKLRGFSDFLASSLLLYETFELLLCSSIGLFLYRGVSYFLTMTRERGLQEKHKITIGMYNNCIIKQYSRMKKAEVNHEGDHRD